MYKFYKINKTKPLSDISPRRTKIDISHICSGRVCIHANYIYIIRSKKQNEEGL